VRSSSAGSSFEVRLPAVASGSDSMVTPADVLATKRSVLIVEDNPDAMKALHDLLRLEGHRVITARDGATGLQTLLDERPELAIIDIGLPVLDGLQLARRARAGGYAGRMVALTGYGQSQDVQRSLKAGFDAHLTKPLLTEDLREQISQV